MSLLATVRALPPEMQAFETEIVRLRPNSAAILAVIAGIEATSVSGRASMFPLAVASTRIVFSALRAESASSESSDTISLMQPMARTSARDQL